MRIAIVSPFVDRRHGTERALAELIERLAKKFGCEIHLYAERVEDLGLDSPEAQPVERRGAVRWHRVPAVRGPHVVRFLAWMLLNGLLRRWHRWSNNASYDLLVSPGINCLSPDVVIIHALFFRLRDLANEEQQKAVSPGNSWRRLHRRLYYRLLTALERRVYRKRNVTLAAVSFRTAQLVETTFGREDVAVVPNGVDSLQFSPARRCTRRELARLNKNLHPTDCVLLLVGNDWRVKGLGTVLEAMSLMRESPVRLIAAGSEDADSWRAEAIRLGVEDQCVWLSTGGVDIIDLLAAADIYVSPSREDSFGLPVAEAMACGLPVITSRFAGVSELIRNGADGFIVDDPMDAAALAAIIGTLRSDLDLRQRIGDAACESIRQWDWDRNADAVWKLLETRASQKKGL